MIEIDKGGSIGGVLQGLNKILDMAVAEPGQGGTWIIPARPAVGYGGRRVLPQHDSHHPRPHPGMIKRGMTLEPVKAAATAMDSMRRYGSTTGAWTTDMFVEAAISQPS